MQKGFLLEMGRKKIEEKNRLYLTKLLSMFDQSSFQFFYIHNKNFYFQNFRYLIYFEISENDCFNQYRFKCAAFRI